MHKFIKKIILFFALIFLILCGLDLASAHEPIRTFMAKITNSEDYLVREGSDEMFPYIDKVMQHDESHILVIGDSICRQVFYELDIQDEEITIAAANAAVTVPGQYMLAMAYLDNHPEATDIFLVMHPHSLLHPFSSSTEYQYAVIPFVEKGLFNYLDDYTKACFSESFGKIFLDERTVNLIDNSAINRKIYFNAVEKNGKGYTEKFPFEIADMLIPTLHRECEERGARLHLISSPVTTYFAEDMNIKTQEYERSLTFELYPDYMKNIVFVPTEYTIDKAHFAPEYIDKEMLKGLLAEMMKEDMSSIFIE